MRQIQETIRLYVSPQQSVANTLRAFAGMLETGEASMEDFTAAGVDLEQLCNQYGSTNCWTGSTGSAAAALREAIKSCK